MNQPKGIRRPAAADQRSLDKAARADAREGIRQGMEEARRGKGRDIEKFFAEFEKLKHIY